MARRTDALQFVRRDRITSTPTLRGKVASVVEMIKTSCAAGVSKLAFVVVSLAHGVQHGDGNGTLASAFPVRFPCHFSSLFSIGWFTAAGAERCEKPSGSEPLVADAQQSPKTAQQSATSLITVTAPRADAAIATTRA